MAEKATKMPFRRKVAWTAGDIIGIFIKKVTTLKGKLDDLESRTLNRLLSPKYRLGVDFEVTSDGTLVSTNTKEKKKYNIIDLDQLPWEYENQPSAQQIDDYSQRNYNLLVDLLNNRSLVTIEVFAKPDTDTLSSVRQEFEKRISESRQLGLSTPLWEKDLRALADYIDEQRVDHFRYGIYNSNDVDDPEIVEALKTAELDYLEAGYFAFSLLNGFWNESFFKSLMNKWDKRRRQAQDRGVWTPEWDRKWITQELTHYIIPAVIDRKRPEIPELYGEHGSRLAESAFEISSLGMSTFQEDPDDEESEEISLPNTSAWLTNTLFGEVRNTGDTIIVVSTYYSTGNKLSDRFQKRSEEAYIPHSLTKKEEKQNTADQKAMEKSQELGREVTPVQHLDQAERDYLTLWRVLLDDISNSRDRLVRTHYTVLVQSPNQERTEKLAKNIGKSLNRNNAIYERTNTQRSTLKAQRASLPVILRSNTEEQVSPLHVDGALASIMPEKRRSVSSGALRIPMGVTRYGNLWELPFEDPFGVFSRPRSGKSTLFILFILRADGLLQRWSTNGQGVEIPGSVMHFWDATNTIRPPNPEPEFGLPLVAKRLNQHVDWSQYPDYLKYGVIYATGEPYVNLAKGEAEKKIREDMLMLCKEAKARMTLYRSHKDVLKDNRLDYGYLEAVSYWREVLRSHEVPSVFVADEAIAQEYRLTANLIDHIRGSTKASEAVGIGGHSKKFIPDQPEDLRTEAQSLIPVTLIGGTNLHRLLMEEADINPELFRDEARMLARRIAAITISKTPGHFMLIEGGGGGRMEEGHVIVKDEDVKLLIQRKSKEAAQRLGL